MALGQFVRQLLGKKWARVIGSVYRSCFVNLDRVAKVVAEVIPADATVLDIGGGDGEMLNRLLRLRPDIRVVMLDIGPQVGAFLDAELLPRVSLRPSTRLQDYIIEGEKVGCIMVNDVIHHIPTSDRDDFLRAVHAALEPGGQLIIKEFAPSGFRSFLGFLADRYISGDRNVSFLNSQELESLVRRNMPVETCEQTSLFQVDPPNYAAVFRL